MRVEIQRTKPTGNSKSSPKTLTMTDACTSRNKISESNSTDTSRNQEKNKVPS